MKVNKTMETQKTKRTRGLQLVSLLIFIMPFVALVVCIGIGRYSLSAIDSLRYLLSPLTGLEIEEQARAVIFNVRLPRIILALLVGMGLAVSGAAFQSLFSNPLATPDTLGVATGASFGAIVTMLFTKNLMLMQLSALLFGLVALTATVTIARMNGKTSIIMIVLGGMVVSSLFSAMVSLVKYVADPEDDLPAITYWLLGSMTRATYVGLLIGAPLIIVGVVMIFLLRWRLNILSLQDEEAKTLGVNVKRLRLMVMFASTLTTAASISLCGQVGWVGLLIPHIARMIYGSDNRHVIPASIGLGATFMLVIDTIGRSATASEIPVSILTAVIGAPFFIGLLRKTGGVRL